MNIPGKERPNLVSLFKTYVKRRVVEEEEKWRRYYMSRRNRHGQSYVLYDDYGDEYEDAMEQLRRFYGGCFPRSGGYILKPLSGEDADEWDDEDYDDEDWSEYDDYVVGDDGEIIFPNSNTSQQDMATTLRPGEYRRSKEDMDDYWNKMKKFNGGGGKKKHKKHRSRHKAKTIDINQPYSGFEGQNDEESVGTGIIYFYEDYHDKYDRLEFNGLVEFDEYCNQMGFFVPAYVGEQIAYSPISHCCLNPQAKEQGILEVMREETYGDMFYEACETSELSS